jgi:hypothetical protein
MVPSMSEGPAPEDDAIVEAMGGRRASTKQLLLIALAGAVVAALLAGAAHLSASRDRAAETPSPPSASP